MQVFVEDPEPYLIELGVDVPDLMDSTRKAVLEFATRSRVNFETFFFADPSEKERFDADPTRYAGRIVDPVLRLGGRGDGERGGCGDREGREPTGNVGASNGLDVVLASQGRPPD